MTDRTTARRRRAERLVLQLLRIPGPSCREGRVARAIVGKLRRAGVPESAIVFDRAGERSPHRGEIGNLIVRLPGRRRGPRRLFSAHLDTVPICVGAKVVQENGFLRSAKPGTGIGADNRAGCAIILHCLLEILRNAPAHPPLTFCWFVQEENGLHGSRHVEKRLLGRPAEGYNWDGGSPHKITIGATSGYRMTITWEGTAAHAGLAPERGASAIVAASLAIARLHRDGWLGAIRKREGTGTSNIGTIEGGEATNVVANRAVMTAEVRSHRPAFRQKVIEVFERICRESADRVRTAGGDPVRVTFDGRLDYEAYRMDEGHPAVTAALEAARAAGLEPETAITDGGLDANWLNAYGIPTVSIGCGQLNQHMPTEALDLEAFHAACEMALHLATRPA